MARNCTICGEPMEEGAPFMFHGYDGNDCPKPPRHQDLVVVESGIRKLRDGGIVFFVGNVELPCASMQEAEAMMEDLNAMVAQTGGSTSPGRVQ